MWARACELALAVRLLSSAFLLGGSVGADSVWVPFGADVAVIAIAVAAWRVTWSLRLQLIVALGLVAWGWARFPRPGPAAAQNALLVGLVLALPSVVPSDAGDPPPGWRAHVVEDG